MSIYVITLPSLETVTAAYKFALLDTPLSSNLKCKAGSDNFACGSV
jgi:hypothetical protein